MYNLVITNGQTGFLICTKYVEMYILISTELYKYIRLGIQVSLNITCSKLYIPPLPYHGLCAIHCISM